MGNNPYIVRSNSYGISIINPSFLDCLLWEIDLCRELFYDRGNYLTNLFIRPFGSSISIIYLLNHSWSLDHSSRLSSIENGFKLKHINTNELYFQFGFMFLERELARLNYSFSNLDRDDLTMFAYYNDYQVQSWKISKKDILINHDLTNYYPSVIEYLLRCEFSNRWMDQLQLHKEQPIIEYLISHDRISIYPEESAAALNNFFLNRNTFKDLE